MDKSKFVACIMYLETVYDKLAVTGDARRLRVWYDALGDMPEDVLMLAVKQTVATSKWAPTIAELRQTALAIVQPVSDWAAAWDSVQKAIRYHGAWDEAGAMETLDAQTKTAVRAIGYKNLCQSENPVADRAHFERIYKQITQTKQQEQALPAALRQAIESRREAIGDGRKDLSGDAGALGPSNQAQAGRNPALAGDGGKLHRQH